MQESKETLDPLGARQPSLAAKTGRASFLLALTFGGLSVLLILALAVVHIANNVGHGADPPMENLLRVVVVLSLGGNLVGLVLGIMAVNRQDHQIGAASAGLVLNGLVLAGGVLFMICYFLYGL